MPSSEPIRLHIGGTTPREGWRILNIQPGPDVDFLGSATDLSVFPDNTLAEIYGSHIYEHLSYSTELLAALKEAFRALAPGGLIKIGIPDLEGLCRLFLDPALPRQQKFSVMRMIYGGQTDPFDFHKGGYSFELMGEFLHAAGFRDIQRVQDFGLFQDTTILWLNDTPISLNIQACKPHPEPQP